MAQNPSKDTVPYTYSSLLRSVAQDALKWQRVLPLFLSSMSQTRMRTVIMQTPLVIKQTGQYRCPIYCALVPATVLRDKIT